MVRYALLLLLALAACSQGTDDGPFDTDGDGTVDAEDCAPSDATIYPGNLDEPGDTIDSNCDGMDGMDLDGDGYVEQCDPDELSCEAEDCDDRDPAVHPGAQEIIGDGLDNDCDGFVDQFPGDDDDDTAPLDSDSDGFTTDVDCDDSDASVHPGADDPCDEIDADCDGMTYEACFEGSWVVDSPVEYNCAVSSVRVRVSGLSLATVNDELRADPGPEGNAPGVMLGDWLDDQDAVELFAGDTGLLGTCEMEFTLTGSFQNSSRIGFELLATFAGTGVTACGTCETRSWTFTADRASD